MGGRGVSWVECYFGLFAAKQYTEHMACRTLEIAVERQSHEPDILWVEEIIRLAKHIKFRSVNGMLDCMFPRGIGIERTQYHDDNT